MLYTLYTYFKINVHSVNLCVKAFLVTKVTITCHPLGSPKVLEDFAAKLARISAYKWCDYKKLCNAFFKNNFQLKGFYHLTNSYYNIIIVLIDISPLIVESFILSCNQFILKDYIKEKKPEKVSSFLLLLDYCSARNNTV